MSDKAKKAIFPPDHAVTQKRDSTVKEPPAEED